MFWLRELNAEHCRVTACRDRTNMADQNSQDAPVTDPDLYRAFNHMKRREFGEARALLDKGVAAAKTKNDLKLEGLYCSALGVLAKLMGDYKQAYKHYQQAEKFIPEDTTIKIIAAVLLIEEFKQYDTAVRKLEKILIESTDPAVIHHARGILAIGYFALGKKDKAAEAFKKQLAEDFVKMRFAANLDFKAVEFFVQKGFLPEECREYLNKALELAKKNREKTYQAVIEKLLELIP